MVNSTSKIIAGLAALVGLAATVNAQPVVTVIVPTGWTESYALDISADGSTIVGAGLSPTGVRSFR